MKKLFYIILLIFSSNLTFSRTISVVYDDSGSMKKNDKWVYANYAFQTLISLLDKKDNLYIVKMSEVEKGIKSKKVSLEKQNGLLGSIKSDYRFSSQTTPYTAIVESMDLMNIFLKDSKSDDNWIVIITDGEFEDGKKFTESEKNTYKNKIYSFIDKSKAKPIFLIISNDKKEEKKLLEQDGIAIWKEVFGANALYPKVFTATGENEIIQKMQSIAYLITSKNEKSSIVDYQDENNTITFNSEFPLKRVLIFEQSKDKSFMKPKEVIVNGEKIRSQKLLEPEIQSNGIKLFANTNTLENESTLSPGQIKIMYEGNSKSIKILPEVDAEFKVKLLNGNETIVDSFYKTYPNNKLKIEASLQEKNSQNSLKHIEGIKVVSYYNEEEVPLNYNDKTKKYEGEILVKEGKKSISASAEFPGYFNFQSDIYTIDAHESYIVKRNIDLKIIPEKISIPITELKKYNNLNFIPLVNGLEIDVEEFKTWKIEIETDLKIDVEKEFKKIDNKELNLWQSSFNYGNLFFWTLPKAGKHKVKLKIDSGRADEFIEKEFEINMEKESWAKVQGPFWGLFVGGLLSVLFILGNIFKQRFSKGAKIIFSSEHLIERTKDREETKKLSASFINKIIPFQSEKMLVRGIMFYASENNRIKIKKGESKLIGKTVDNIEIAYMEKSIDDIKKKEHRLSSGDTIDVLYKGGKKDTYRYEKK